MICSYFNMFELTLVERFLSLHVNMLIVKFMSSNIAEKKIEKKKYQTKGYLTIFTSQALSLLGSSIVNFALIWYLTIETGSAVILSVAMFVGMVPVLIISPLSGVLSDRLN